MNENILPPPGTASAPDAVSAPATDRKIIIVGLGGCGAKTLNAFVGLPGSQEFDTLLLETDKDAAAQCRAKELLCAEAGWTADKDMGCGGDPMKGERAFARERAKLTQLLSGHDFAVVAGGLGGGTATGGVRIVASIVRGLAIPAVFMLSTPFSFESYARRRRAEQCLADLLSVTEALAPLPNDLLFSTLPPDTGVEDAFNTAATELASSILGLAELFRGRKLIGPDYAELSVTLRKGSHTCAFGTGVAAADESLDRCSLALERMLESPFLGGMDRLASCGALLVSIIGGDLRLAEMKRTLENLTSLLPAGVQVSAGAAVHPGYGGSVRISSLAVYYDHPRGPEPEYAQDQLWDFSRRSASANPDAFEQGLLNLQSYSKGIFANCPPVKYKDEDLDVPTFQRRGIVIDKGDTAK